MAAADEGITKQIIADIRQKISNGEINGNETLKWTFLIVADVHDQNRRHLEDCKKNPMIRLGELMVQFPKLSMIGLVVAWFLIGMTAVLAIMGAASQLGLTIIPSP